MLTKWNDSPCLFCWTFCSGHSHLRWRLRGWLLKRIRIIKSVARSLTLPWSCIWIISWMLYIVKHLIGAGISTHCAVKLSIIVLAVWRVWILVVPRHLIATDGAHLTGRFSIWDFCWSNLKLPTDWEQSMMPQALII